ncbi:hypothetical protein niasHT_008636 [Heterodera trifolii]|uniref:DNA-directed RNA polymerases I, II, and III subunit RPABC5 n=1 Tax=Heterodera trifolii TaxID=157864 RepID=A0ABD2LW74_9BILA
MTDSMFKYDQLEQRMIHNVMPWEQDPHYFKEVKISALALLKMVMHVRSGGNIEIMGLDRLGLRRYCCRRMLLSHVDLIEKLLNNDTHHFARRVGPIGAAPLLLPSDAAVSRGSDRKAALQWPSYKPLLQGRPVTTFSLRHYCCRRVLLALISHHLGLAISKRSWWVMTCTKVSQSPHAMNPVTRMCRTTPPPQCDEPGDADVPHHPSPSCDEPGDADVPHRMCRTTPPPQCDEPGDADVPHHPSPSVR